MHLRQIFDHGSVGTTTAAAMVSPTMMLAVLFALVSTELSALRFSLRVMYERAYNMKKRRAPLVTKRKHEHWRLGFFSTDNGGD